METEAAPSAARVKRTRERAKKKEERDDVAPAGRRGQRKGKQCERLLGKWGQDEGRREKKKEHGET